MTKDELKEKAKAAADAKLEQELLRTKFKNADDTRYKWYDWYKELYAQYLYEEGLGEKPKPKREISDGVTRMCDLEDIVPTDEIPATTKSLSQFTEEIEPLEFIPDTQDYYVGQELPEVPTLTSICKLSKTKVNKRFNDKKHPLFSDFGNKFENLENASFADFTLAKVNGVDGKKHMDRYDIETNQDLVVVWANGKYSWVAKTAILDAMRTSLQGLSKEVLQRNKLWSKVENKSIYDIDKFWTNFFEISSIINLRLDDFYGYEVHQKDMRLGDTKPIWVQTSQVNEWKNYERPKLFQRNVETFEDFGNLTEEEEYNLDMANEKNNIEMPSEQVKSTTQVDLSPMLEVMSSLKDEINSLKREIRLQQNGISEKQNSWQVQFEKQAQNTENLYSEIEKLKTTLQDNALVEQVQDLRGVVQELKEVPQSQPQGTQTPQEPKGGILSGLLGDDVPQTSGLSDFLNKEDSMLKEIGLGEKEQPKPYTNADRKRDRIEAHYNEEDSDTEDLPEDIAWLRSLAQKRRDATDDFERDRYDNLINDAFENDPILNSVDDDFADKIVTGEADRETVDKLGNHLIAMMEAIGEPTLSDLELDSSSGEADFTSLQLSDYIQKQGDNFIVSKCVTPGIQAQSISCFRDSGQTQPHPDKALNYVKKRDFDAYKNREGYIEQDKLDQEMAKELKKQSKSQSEINKAVKLFRDTNLKTLSEVFLVLAQPCIMSNCGSRYATFSSHDNIAILSPVIPYSQHFKNAASNRPSIEMKIEEKYPKPKRFHHKRDDLDYYKRYQLAKNTEDEAIVFSREKVNKLVREAEKLGLIKCVNSNSLHYKHSGQAKRYAINYYVYKALCKYLGVSFNQLKQIEQRRSFKFVKALRRKAQDIKRVEQGIESDYLTKYEQEFKKNGFLIHKYKGVEYELHSYADVVDLNELIKADMTPRKRIDATTKQVLNAQERRANKQTKRLCEAFNENATQETKLILSPVSKRPWTECGMDKSKRQNDRAENKFDVTSSIVNITRAKNGLPYTTTSKEEFYQYCCDEMISPGGKRALDFETAKPYVKRMILSLGFSNTPKEANSLLSKVSRFANATVTPINGGHLPDFTEEVLADEEYLRWLCNCYRYDLDYLVKIIQANACLTSEVMIYTYKKARNAIVRAKRFFKEHIGQENFDSTVFLQEGMVMIATALDMQTKGDTPEIYFDCIASKTMTSSEIEKTYLKYYDLYKSFTGKRKRDTKFVNKVLEDLHIPSDKNTS